MTEPPRPPVPQDPYSDPPQNIPSYNTPSYDPAPSYPPQSYPPPSPPAYSPPTPPSAAPASTPPYGAPPASTPPYGMPPVSAQPYGAPVSAPPPTNPYGVQGAPPPAKKGKTGLIVGIVGGVLALCLVGLCVVGGIFFLNGKDKDKDPTAFPTSFPTSYDFPSYTPPSVAPTTEAPPPAAPARVGDCIAVNESGDFQGVGNCSKGGATYKVLTVDYNKGECANPDSGWITVDGYRLCLERYLLETYCYKFPTGDGWIVPASKCKAKGTVHIIDIVPGATNGDKCTKQYKWNYWYKFTNPTTVYCVMKY